ncbi:MAG: hypothetical protein A3G80_10155 [Betaproteobacteria bacterium RIFCSPLOWO2_12_FULL_62_13b]|nr:MAG: hypothetical protein A3G80_10155 [Betaproteobacteria bacterium RIFCSPLOWO2_12_FULL_62_13b]
MDCAALLQEITHYCRSVGLAESTFGKLAVNDGKFVNRLRDGGRITTVTLDRIKGFIACNPPEADQASRSLLVPTRRTTSPLPAAAPAPAATPVEKNFRFFDNRQKYLLFVNTCSEKWDVAERVSQELTNLKPRPPAVRVFDAGIGDGTVLARVMRAMHHRFTTMPFYVVGKEISLEDVRLALEKMPDRFFEHPATVLVLTNLNYSDAPWLVPQSLTAATSLIWHEVALTGNTGHEFEEQITALQPFLAEAWKTTPSRTTGNPLPDRPAVLVLYREDHRFLLDPLIPRRGGTRADYDMVIASQPYRARASLDFKVKRVVAPLARSLGPGGRLIGIHSHGNDPGVEILQGIWPGENPFIHDRHQILKGVKTELGSHARHLNFNTYSDARSLFRYSMHALPSEVSESIGTSTVFAAWNAAIYVGQVEDSRLEEVITDRRYLEVTRDVLHKHNGLWFWDESYVISRRSD